MPRFARSPSSERPPTFTFRYCTGPPEWPPVRADISNFRPITFSIARIFRRPCPPEAREPVFAPAARSDSVALCKIKGRFPET